MVRRRRYDAHWAAPLFKAANIRPVFALGDWHRLAAMAGPEVRERSLDGWSGLVRGTGRATTPKSSCSAWPMLSVLRLVLLRTWTSVWQRWRCLLGRIEGRHEWRRDRRSEQRPS